MAIVYQNRRKDTNEVFYIGIGKTTNRAKSKRARNTHWLNIANKFGYETDILIKGLSWEAAIQVEIGLIKDIGRLDLKKGPLVNMTDGGEGLSNVSKETISKFRNARIGKHLSEETKGKLKSIMSAKKPINRIKVLQYDLDLNLITTWNSIRAAYLHTGIATSSISKCCKNKLKRAGKFIWRYLN
jgi:hypothetical protein